MNINEFVSQYNNHPVLFVGTGISLRYLSNTYSWDNLLKKISIDLKGNNEYYLTVKHKYFEDGKYRYDKIATEIEEEFNNLLLNDRNGKFKEVNDAFFKAMNEGNSLSRFKIYIAKLLSEFTYKKDKQDEIKEFKKIRKNIGSIVTTNYDKFIEDTFEFTPLIGNNILLSNPYGSVYKIHGCVSDPSRIIINEKDYIDFESKYELIRAQLLSLFIHNPIIFIGYNVGDSNIKNILKTIFTYVEPNSDIAREIRSNFLLIEYEENSTNLEVNEHDIDMEGFSTIRINKIRTDNYEYIYKALAGIHLPISAMDVRKVQSVVKEIYAGGEIKVSITEDLETLKNRDKILAIGSHKTISYQYQTSAETISNYFKILDESNFQLLSLIDKYKIQKNQYFPIYGFSVINPNITVANKLKTYQVNNLKKTKESTPNICKKKIHSTIDSVLSDPEIFDSYECSSIIYLILEDKIKLDDAEKYLRNYNDKHCTNFRKLLCAYDYMRYKNNSM